MTLTRPLAQTGSAISKSDLTYNQDTEAYLNLWQAGTSAAVLGGDAFGDAARADGSASIVATPCSNAVAPSAPVANQPQQKNPTRQKLAAAKIRKAILCKPV